MDFEARQARRPPSGGVPAIPAPGRCAAPRWARRAAAVRSRFAAGGARPWLAARKALVLLGPAFVAAVAYVDPGNFATNFQAGAEHRYLLVWVVVMASLMAMLIQYQTAKLGLVTRQQPARVLPRALPAPGQRCCSGCRPRLIAMATDLAEFTGAAIGLHLVFGLPLFLAGLVTAVVAFAVLALERWGYRPFEVAIFALLMLVALGFRRRFLRRRAPVLLRAGARPGPAPAGTAMPSAWRSGSSAPR